MNDKDANGLEQTRSQHEEVYEPNHDMTYDDAWAGSKMSQQQQDPRHEQQWQEQQQQGQELQKTLQQQHQQQQLRNQQ